MSWKEKLFRPVDNSPLVVFRMIFGFLIFAEAWGAIATGWVRRAFIEPDYFFPFINFSWLEPLPGNGMYFYYIIMGIAGLMVMLGLYYKLGIGIYAVMWSAVYLMQKTHYNNHYYLLMLLCWIMLIVPAHKYASLDAKRKPQLKSLTCPQWCLWIFVIQITIVYFYASVAKMNPDWISGKPIEILFKSKTQYFLIGPLLAMPWLQSLATYGGILFDLLIAPGLMYKKTRKLAFISSLFFHLFNSAVFQVGIFPFMAISFALFFFAPEVIRKIFLKNKPALEVSENRIPYQVNYKLIYAFAIYFAFQAFLPVRHWLYKGNVGWTEEGHRLSWRMMLRVKSGHVKFEVKEPSTGETWSISPQTYLTRKQASKIASRPDMCWQFVQILKDDFKSRGHHNIEIYAQGKVSLNGRKYSPLYDSSINLAKVRWSSFQHAEWLLPIGG